MSRDGQVVQTLSKLLFAPGALTADYLAGRRVRYLRPFRLYLMTSLVVFATVQFFGWNLSVRLYGEQGIHILRSTRPAAPQSQAEGLRMSPVQIVQDHFDTPGIRRFAAMTPEEKFSFLGARRVQYVSYLVLLLVPAFAFTLGLFYRSRRRPYTEHLVFGLHCQTFLLLALLVEARLPAVAANAVSWWVIAWFMIALRRVYGGTWPETLWRGSIILMLYFAAYFSANLLLVFALLAL